MIAVVGARQFPGHHGTERRLERLIADIERDLDDKRDLTRKQAIDLKAANITGGAWHPIKALLLLVFGPR